MIIGAGALYAELHDERIIALAGRFGAGKTAQAFELARYYLERGYRFICNTRSVWDDGLSGVRHSVCVVDEGGMYLRRWDDFADLAHYLRKLDIYLFVPSKRLPHTDLACLTARPWLQLRALTGIPATIWSWIYDDGSTSPYGGKYVAVPTELGCYDTLDLSASPREIIDAISAEIERQQRAYGRDGIQRLGGVASGVPSPDDASDALRFAASQITRASISISRSASRQRR